MRLFPYRPPRSGNQRFCVLLLILLALGCASSSVYRTDELRAHIRSNFFSTEHLAFGADPRSVNAVRSLTSENDIPILVSLLSDSSTAVVRIAQYVLVSYEEKSLPHLEDAANGSQSSDIARETIAMIRNRKTQ